MCVGDKPDGLRFPTLTFTGGMLTKDVLMSVYILDEPGTTKPSNSARGEEAHRILMRVCGARHRNRQRMFRSTTLGPMPHLRRRRRKRRSGLLRLPLLARDLRFTSAIKKSGGSSTD